MREKRLERLGKVSSLKIFRVLVRSLDVFLKVVERRGGVESCGVILFGFYFRSSVAVVMFVRRGRLFWVGKFVFRFGIGVIFVIGNVFIFLLRFFIWL